MQTGGEGVAGDGQTREATASSDMLDDSLGGEGCRGGESMHVTWREREKRQRRISTADHRAHWAPAQPAVAVARARHHSVAYHSAGTARRRSAPP